MSRSGHALPDFLKYMITVFTVNHFEMEVVDNIKMAFYAMGHFQNQREPYYYGTKLPISCCTCLKLVNFLFFSAYG